MPLYEYKCQKCGDVFELIQRFSDAPLTVHEKCGGEVERLVSVSALQFKGSGWYVNDYGKGNSKDPKPKPEKSNGTSESSSKNESSGKSDSSSKSDSPSKSESSSKSDSSSKTDSSSSSTASKPSASKSDSK
jgi:putative FmdB family regulatory protein